MFGGLGPGLRRDDAAFKLTSVVRRFRWDTFCSCHRFTQMSTDKNTKSIRVHLCVSVKSVAKKQGNEGEHELPRSPSRVSANTLH